jgi:type VI secretion system protein ImpE
MTAQELLREGQLDEALAALQQEIRQSPADAKLRVFLFQLLAVQGQWDRALTQLSVVGELDALALPMVQTYREAIRCEVLRSEVFAGKRTPLIFGEPPPWVALLLEALRLAAQGRHAEAGPLREQALDAAPALSGGVHLATRITDKLADETDRSETFTWLADADSRLGPLLEAIVNGRYYWIPLDRVQRLDLEPPTDLRDVVWMPGHFQWTNGGEAVALLPTRYPGSAEHQDPQIRLARRTEWLEPAAGVYFGLGQRLLSSDAGEYALMDLRQLTLNAA